MSEWVIRFVVVLLCTICAIIVSYDAYRRRMNGPLWGVLTFLFSIVALPVYLIVRKPLPSMPKGRFESPPGAGMSNTNAAPKRIRLKH